MPTHGGNAARTAVRAHAPRSFPDTWRVPSVRRSDARIVMCASLPILPCVACRLRGLQRSGVRHPSSFLQAECLLDTAVMTTSDTPDTALLRVRCASAVFLIPVSCVLIFSRRSVHLSGIVSDVRSTFRICAARTALRPRRTLPLRPLKDRNRSGQGSQSAATTFIFFLTIGLHNTLTSSSSL